MPRRLLPAALAAALLQAPLAAAAADRVAVVALDAPAELRFTGKALAAAVARVAAKDPALTVLGPEQVEARLGRDVAGRLAGCGASAPCLAGLSRRLGVDRVVGGSLSRAGASYRVALVQADVRTGAALASWDGEVPVASRRLAAAVAEAAPGLLAARPAPGAPTRSR